MKKLLALLLVILAGAGVASYELGYLGRWIGHARVEVTPRDSAMLAFFPRDAKGLGGFQVPLAQPAGKLGDRLRDLARDLEDVTGVRVAFDVDTIVGDADVQVARGRFNWAKMSERLAANGYQLTNEARRPLAVRKDGDALCVDGEYLLHGPFEHVKAALDRRADGSGGNEKSRLAIDLDAIGWSHAAFGVVRLSEDGTSVAQVLKGEAPVRAIGASIDTTPNSFLVGVAIRASSTGSASDIAGEAERAKKAVLDELAKSTDPDANRLKPVIESITIRAEGPVVRLGVTIPSELVDRGFERSQELGGQLRNAVMGAASSAFGSLLGAFGR
ncbi:MAG: hypothetical protein HYV07_26150 [Deltaproteobacteria bacterium]|nr:hypothetical protein [Deltaproteobacteria bacterium]